MNGIHSRNRKKDVLFAPLLVSSQQGSAANLRAKADRLVAQSRFAEASAAYLRLADRYAALGDPNAAQIVRDYSRRYRTDARLYVDDVPARPDRLARNEPPAGCYLGANVEKEDGANRNPALFSGKLGRDHALFFTYRAYGQPFPSDWARRVRSLGAGLQIAWEPRDLRQTEDGAYLNRFMADAARSGIPVFLRFASEMNGDWTPYHTDPEAYREAFRRVAAVAHAAGTNLAMVWCPADSPEKGLDAYYPGPEAVDWVGVNFYSVLYNDGNRGRAAAWRHPEDSLDYVYRRYAGRHPMMVGEWAATHRSVVDGVLKSDFAVDKIGQFYAAVPRRYPRVKAVHWLSLDTARYAVGTRRLNDFTLLSDLDVAVAYSRATAEPFFLGHVGDVAASAPRSLANGDALSSEVVLSAYARSYVPRPRTTIVLDGKIVLDESCAGAHRVGVALSKGKHVISLLVWDGEGRVAGKQTVAVGTL